MSRIFSIGHSNLPYANFLQKLREHRVTALTDVRTTPYSVYQPHFDEPQLSQRLKNDGIAYVGMGPLLGGRPADPSLYIDGRANYAAMEQSELFKNGVDRLITGSQKFNIAMMCSEGDPATCHRCLLIGRHMAQKHGFDLRHIHGDLVLSQDDITKMLVERVLKKPRGASAELHGDVPPDPSDPNLEDIAYLWQSDVVTYKRKLKKERRAEVQPGVEP